MSNLMESMNSERLISCFASEWGVREVNESPAIFVWSHLEPRSPIDTRATYFQQWWCSKVILLNCYCAQFSSWNRIRGQKIQEPNIRTTVESRCGLFSCDEVKWKNSSHKKWSTRLNLLRWFLLKKFFKKKLFFPTFREFSALAYISKMKLNTAAVGRGKSLYYLRNGL